MMTMRKRGKPGENTEKETEGAVQQQENEGEEEQKIEAKMEGGRGGSMAVMRCSLLLLSAVLLVLAIVFPQVIDSELLPSEFADHMHKFTGKASSSGDVSGGDGEDTPETTFALKIYSKEDLRKFDGTDSNPVFLSIGGKVCVCSYVFT